MIKYICIKNFHVEGYGYKDDLIFKVGDIVDCVVSNGFILTKHGGDTTVFDIDTTHFMLLSDYRAAKLDSLF